MVYRIIFIISLLFCSTLSFSQETLTTSQLLSTTVNSDAQEIYPLISSDEQILLFARKEHSQNIGKDDLEDIWMSKKTGQQQWSKAIQVGPPVNNAKANIPIGINASGTTLYIWNKTDNKLLLSHKDGRLWQFPEEMTITNADTLRQYGYFQVSIDGKYLLFSAIASKNKGNKRDLFVCYRTNDREWSVPQSLGPAINTIFDERNAFLAADGKTLYFTSKAYSSFGGYDLFISRRVDESWTQWTPPVNLGVEFNSAKDETCISIPANGERAYFSDGKDLYSVPIPKDWQPEPVTILTGKVVTAYKQQITPARIVTGGLIDPEQHYADNASEGQFELVLPYGSNLEIFAEQEGFFSASETLELGNEQVEELDYDPKTTYAALNDASYEADYKELEGMQLRLNELNDELRLINQQRAAHKKELARKKPNIEPQSDPELDALRHKFNNYQRANAQDTIPKQEESVIPNNFNFISEEQEDDELEDLKKRFRKHYDIEPEPEEEFVWEDENSNDFDSLKRAAQYELNQEISPLVRNQLKLALFPDVKKDLSRELDSDSWRKLQEQENAFLEDIQNSLSATQRSDSKQNQDNIWQQKLKNDIKVAMKDEVEDALKAELEEDIKKTLKSELTYLAIKGLEDDMQTAIDAKIEQQKLLEINLDFLEDSLATTSHQQTNLEQLQYFNFVEKDILLYPVEEDQIIPLHNIFFNANKSTLKRESYKELNRVLDFLEKNEQLRVEIGGHTNGWLSYSQAQILSEERARVVKDFLVGNGIPEDRITDKGYGKSKPIVSNDTEDGRKKNQRIELKIIAID